jgi:hypothetical protein
MTDTLRSICEQCPQLSAPQLDFIPPELARNKEIVRRDLRELVTAANNELDRSVVLLAGSVLESVLFSFLSGQEAYIGTVRGKPFTFSRDMSLQNYKEQFNSFFGRAIPGSRLPDLVVDYRDTIHINRELEQSDDVCSRASREMLRILDKLLTDLAGFASTDPLTNP